MKILLANDDGVNAPGIKELWSVLHTDHQVTVVAPATEKSASGHAIDIKRHLELHQLENGFYALDGFPADCVKAGLKYVLKDDVPDLVISGINRGANMAQDTYYSGTVAAAREATLWEVPSIAISVTANVYDKNEHVYFETAAKFLKKLLDNDGHKLIQEKMFLNINVPNIPTEQVQGVEVTRLGFRRYEAEVVKVNDMLKVHGGCLGHDPIPNSDCVVVHDKHKISLTPIDVLSAYSNCLEGWKEFSEKLVI